MSKTKRYTTDGGEQLSGKTKIIIDGKVVGEVVGNIEICDSQNEKPEKWVKWVKCVDNEEVEGHLTVGKKYKVYEYNNDGFVKVQSDKGVHYYYIEGRFEFCKPPKEKKQWVKCVDNTSEINSYLTIGKKYRSLGHSGKHITVNNDKGDVIAYFLHRFEFCKPPKTDLEILKKAFEKVGFEIEEITHISTVTDERVRYTLTLDGSYVAHFYFDKDGKLLR